MAERTGIVLVDKDKGLTSHEVVDRIREIFEQRRVGHMGTLDPQATGLIVIAVGRATRLFPFLVKGHKVYRGKIRLGIETDTYDAEGKVVREVKDFDIPEALLRKTMKEFVGKIKHKPPPYSAKKVRGKRLYELARLGEKVDPEPIEVTVFYWRLLSYEPPYFTFDIKCSTGTYVRSLAHELGQKLGVGAHLAELRRLRSGEFSVEQAHTLEEIEEFKRQGKLDEIVIPVNKVLQEYPIVYLTAEGARRARHGNFIPLRMVGEIEGPTQAEYYRMMDFSNNFIGMGKPVKRGSEAGFQPVMVLANE